MRTLRIDLSWSGAEFAGWQRQPRLRTVQGVLEDTLARVVGQSLSVIGCGRTDAGTHAWHHVSSVRTTSRLPAAEIERALEALLPADMAVVALRDADDSFHAQRDALWKWYRYRVLVSRRRQPLVGARAWLRAHAPARDALQHAVDPLSGRHDFASFAKAGSTPGTKADATVRTMHALVWHEGRADGDEGVPCGAPLLVLDVIGEGFLWKMVRTIVGTSWRAAREVDPSRHVREVLAVRDRRAAGPAAPAAGLTLMAVAMAGDPVPSLPAHLQAAWQPPDAASPGPGPSDPSPHDSTLGGSADAPEAGATGASFVPRRPS